MMTIDGYRIDAEISGEPTYENEVTDFPIESGGNTTDHCIRKPVMFSCEGVVSDTPLGDIRDDRTIQGTLSETDSGLVTFEGEEVSDAITRDAHARMIAIYENKLPVIVKCSLGVFESMLLTSYTPKREGGSIRFSATFKLATFVRNERTIVAMPRAAKASRLRMIPSNLKDERGRSIFRNVVGDVKSGNVQSVYVDKNGKPLTQAQVNRAHQEVDAVQVNYVNGKPVPVNPSDYQPYGAAEPPFWPDSDKVRPVKPSDFKTAGSATDALR